jgi:hypothetical protein
MFSRTKNIRFIGPPVPISRIRFLEAKLGLKFPETVCSFYQKHNAGLSNEAYLEHPDFDFGLADVYGIGEENSEKILSQDLDFKNYSTTIHRAYSLSNLSEKYLPLDMVPFADDGVDIIYCFYCGSNFDGSIYAFPSAMSGGGVSIFLAKSIQEFFNMFKEC